MNEKNKYDIIKVLIFIGVILASLLVGVITGLLLIKHTYLFSTITGLDKYDLFLSLSLLAYMPLAVISKYVNEYCEYLIIQKENAKIESIEYEYYRDIIDKYSIILLAKCIGKVKKEDLFVATLLKLKVEKKIEVTEDEVKIINEDDLFPSEINFLRAFKGTKTYSSKTYEGDIYSDFYLDNEKSRLFEDPNFSKKDYVLISLLLMPIIGLAIEFLFPHTNELLDLLAVVIITLPWFFVFAFTKIFKTYKLTQEGKDIRNKLLGSKQFLKDFSNIGDKQIDELIHWDYYMVYAVLFDLEGKLDNEAYKYYKKYIKKNVN